MTSRFTPSEGCQNGEAMTLRVLRVVAGVLLGASGALMCAASWQRWAGACSFGDVDETLCDRRQDHLYDFVPPMAPWEPVGDAAQLAGWSLLVLALAFVLLPWALTGRRPGHVAAVALVGAVVAIAAVGVATLCSGLAGSLVSSKFYGVALFGWLLLPLVLLVRFAVAARGWPLAAAIWLVLANPFVAGLSYSMGSYDARPWWEAISGLLTVTAGLCLLAAAVFGRSGTHESPVTVASPAGPSGAVSFS